MADKFNSDLNAKLSTFFEEGTKDNSFQIQNLKLESQLAFFEAIKKEEEKITQEKEKQLSTEEMMRQISEDRAEKRNKQLEKEFKRTKEIKALEISIIEAKSKHNKEEEKKLTKRLENLKKVQEIEKATQEIIDKYSEDRELRQRRRDAIREAQSEGKKLLKDAQSFSEFTDGLALALTGGLSGGTGFAKAIDTIISGLSDISKKLDKTIEEVIRYKSDWDTRLFGSSSNHESLTKQITDSIGASPYVKQADVMKNIDEAVKAGIAYNVEQRAFLQTVKDDIAGTFNAFDSTLLQIVRIQQQDSTAARLGMEAALNQYLNSMFTNTEYLSNASDGVTRALYEATSLLSSEQSIGFEYQVQKWLGSLYSVGMSGEAISNIAQALGQMASGDVSGVSSGAGKLLVMSAAKAGIPYNELLTKGINDSQINNLLESMVEYLKTIADSNKVVQSQYAAVFGLRTSDIIAAANLGQGDINNIARYSLSNRGALSSLYSMGGSISSRMGLGEKMSNALDNLQYTMASSIASNPALYALWSISGMLDELVGGIPIPFINTFFGGIDLHTTVADLMRVGAMSGGILSGMGSLVKAANASSGQSGINGILNALGVNNRNIVTRGTGLTSGLAQTTSSMSYIGNTSGEDIKEASLASAEAQKEEVSQTYGSEEEQDNTKLGDINSSIIQIYSLLDSVVNGSLKFSVRVGNEEAWTENV